MLKDLILSFSLFEAEYLTNNDFLIQVTYVYYLIQTFQHKIQTRTKRLMTCLKAETSHRELEIENQLENQTEVTKEGWSGR